MKILQIKSGKFNNTYYNSNDALKSLEMAINDQIDEDKILSINISIDDDNEYVSAEAIISIKEN